MSRDAVRHRIRAAGPWQQILPRVYLAATGTPTPLQKEIATVLYTGPDSVITGLTALRRHGLHVPDRPDISVLVPAQQSRLSRSFAHVRPTTRMPARVCFEGPVQFALPARAVADAARELDSFREVRAVVADAVQRRSCRIDSLREELASGPTRYSAWLRHSLAEVADGIRSVAEGDFRHLVQRSGLPMPMFNARLYNGEVFIAVADAWWGDAGVVAEVDSRAWHLSPEDWERTAQRHARMSAHGIIVLHFSPSKIWNESARVEAEVRSALAAGRARPTLAVRAVGQAD